MSDDEDILSEFNNYLNAMHETQNISQSEKYPIIQINGRRIYGPPENWIGPEPSISAELFIKQIPKTMLEYDIIPLFERFGTVYEFRLMMDYNNLNRGYAYIRFANVVQALRAMTVMNHYIVARNKSFDIKQSYNKCRLFVGNIPRHLERNEIENTFRQLFPEMKSFVLHQKISENIMFKNRGFGFIDFEDHKIALSAKKRCASGVARLWNRDIKIVWANPERNVDTETLNEVRTLFIRHVHMSVTESDLLKYVMQYVDKSLVKKISRNRELAFIEFVNRSAAQIILDNFQGLKLNGYEIQVQWAIPATDKSLHSHRLSNFDTIFRLKCIANDWDQPVVIYGRIHPDREIQIVAVMIRKSSKVHAYLFEASLMNCRNLHARIYETLVQLIEDEGDLPNYNYIIYLHNDAAHIVGHVPDLNNPIAVVASQLPSMFEIHWDDIRDLCATIKKISVYKIAELYRIYEATLHKNMQCNYIDNFIVNNCLIIGCLERDIFSEKLKYDLDDHCILLALCDINTGTNYSFPYKPVTIYQFMSVHSDDVVFINPIYRRIPLMPMNLFIGNYHVHAKGIYFGVLQTNLIPTMLPPQIWFNDMMTPTMI